MNTNDFFANPETPSHRHYEALRAFYTGDLSASEAADRFGFSPRYFKKLRFQFVKMLRESANPFFIERKPGPKRRQTTDETKERIVTLRKQNYSILDIKAVLDAEEKTVSLDTINKILKSEGFAPLYKRTRNERQTISLPQKLKTPRSTPLELKDEEFTSEIGAGPLIFLPLLEEFGIIEAIKVCEFPKTSEISDVQSVLSFLALKILGGMRWSYDSKWSMDRSLGFFAGLNVLPKSTSLSSYSYSVFRKMNRSLLIQLSQIFKDDDMEEGEFNLDFKTIPHWGDESVLEKNWSGARSKSIKSILALIVQESSTGIIPYTDAEVKKREQNDAIMDFVDFWKEGRGEAPKLLIFDSKLTTYNNLNKLNKSKEKINFLTIRRRSKNLVKGVEKIPENEWQEIKVERAKGKQQTIRVHDGKTTLSKYEGEIRQLIITNHGRQQPTFMITNDFNMTMKNIVEKYSRRWLVEQEIAEQIMFFNLNHPSSSIVVKVDFDLTISLLAHNLYRLLARSLPGFENCTAQTISRKFLENGVKVDIKGNDVTVYLKKKTHLPILFALPWMEKNTKISWMGINIRFSPGTVS